MSSNMSGLFRSRSFILSLIALIMLCVLSSAPCFELFSAAPELKNIKNYVYTAVIHMQSSTACISHIFITTCSIIHYGFKVCWNNILYLLKKIDLTFLCYLIFHKEQLMLQFHFYIILNTLYTRLAIFILNYYSHHTYLIFLYYAYPQIWHITLPHISHWSHGPGLYYFTIHFSVMKYSFTKYFPVSKFNIPLLHISQL